MGMPQVFPEKSVFFPWKDPTYFEANVIFKGDCGGINCLVSPLERAVPQPSEFEGPK